MPLQIESKALSPQTVLYTLEGRLTAGLEVRAFEAELERAKQAGVIKLVIDMKGVSYVDSSGLGALVSGFTMMTKASGTLRLCSIDDRVMKILKITHTDKVLPIDASADEACRKIAE